MNDYKHQDAIVLFSGGQDSTTCLYWAKREFRNVHAICYSYGQRHLQEIENAKRLAEIANVEFSILDTSVISKLAPNSLTDKELVMDREVPNNSYPNTFVPGRNLLFLTFAATIAYAKNIRHIVTGVSEADYSGYPDCRDTFIKSANTTLNLAMDKQFLIHTPLMWSTKRDVWQLADELNVFDLVKNETLTCYNGIIAEGCGDCPACIIRNKGLEEYISERLVNNR